jgi:hypothetical protein
LITFRTPGRAGKTGSMRRCERSLGSSKLLAFRLESAKWAKADIEPIIAE